MGRDRFVTMGAAVLGVALALGVALGGCASPAASTSQDAATSTETSEEPTPAPVPKTATVGKVTFEVPDGWTQKRKANDRGNQSCQMQSSGSKTYIAVVAFIATEDTADVELAAESYEQSVTGTDTDALWDETDNLDPASPCGAVTFAGRTAFHDSGSFDIKGGYHLKGDIISFGSPEDGGIYTVAVIGSAEDGAFTHATYQVLLDSLTFA